MWSESPTGCPGAFESRVDADLAAIVYDQAQVVKLAL
jgi:hypothetical protein